MADNLLVEIVKTGVMGILCAVVLYYSRRDYLEIVTRFEKYVDAQNQVLKQNAQAFTELLVTLERIDAKLDERKQHAKPD